MEIERALVAQGVPLEKARLTALRAPIDGNPLAQKPAGVICAPAALPLSLVIPWSKLCSDNEKEVGGISRMKDGKIVPRKLLTSRYKASKAAIRELAQALVGNAAPLECPLSIHVRVYLPPARRNDSINFAKVVNDALEGVIYLNDNQLHRSIWERVGVDIDAPRAEIEIHAR